MFQVLHEELIDLVPFAKGQLSKVVSKVFVVTSASAVLEKNRLCTAVLETEYCSVASNRV